MNKLYRGTMQNYLAQARAGELLMRHYLEYARSIGVEVVGGIGDAGLVVTPEQAALLDAKWKELTEKP